MQIEIRRWLFLLFLMTGLVLGGCDAQQATSLNTNKSSTDTTSAPVEVSARTDEFKGLPRLQGKATVVMVVKGSPITIEVDGKNAPITAGNFVDLVQGGVYNGLAFHRVVREPQPFVVQGGDPQSKNPNFPKGNLGTGSFIDPATKKPRYIPLEIKAKGVDSPIYSNTLSSSGVSKPPELKHTRGALAMARSQFPDSASAQFYFALADLPFLDGDYAVFGYVKEGMDVIDKIQQGDRIQSAKVTQGAENLKK